MRAIPRAFLAVWLLWLAGGICFAIFYHLPPGSFYDFRSLYGAGYLALHHPDQLYSLPAQQAVQDAADPSVDAVLPFVHLGYEALFYAPLTLLTYRTAYTASVVVNLLLLLACFLSARELFSRVIPIWQPRPGLAFFVFMPLVCTIVQGQDSLLLLLICCMVLRKVCRGQDGIAGALLALALFKFQLALPLLVLLTFRRGWRILAGFLPVAGLLVAGSLVLAGARSVAALRELLVACAMPSRAGDVSLMFVQPARMPNLMGLVFTVLGSSTPRPVAFGIVLLLSIATMSWGAVRMHRAATETEAFAIAILCTELVSYHLYLHDATLLLIPLALWADRAAGALLLTASLLIFLFAPGGTWLLALPIVWLLLDAQTSPLIEISALRLCSPRSA